MARGSSSPSLGQNVRKGIIIGVPLIHSRVLSSYEKPSNALRTTLGQDIEWTTALLGPFIRRMGPKLEDAGKDQTEDG